MSSSPVMPARLLGVLGLAAVLGGCVADIGPLPALTDGKDIEASRTFAAATSPGAALQEDWWKGLGDPQLDRLIDEALAGSPSLAIAAARITQADATASRTSAEAGPTVNGEGAVQEVRQSLNTGFPPSFKAFLPQGWHDQARVDAAVNYQLDFFGKNRAALAAATSNADAVRADAAASRLTLSTAIAGAYADLKQAFADRDAVNEAIAVRTQSAGLMQQRFQQGLENRQPAARAESAAASARTDLAQIDGRIALLRNQLAALMGKGPDRGLTIERPVAGAIQPLAVPTDLAANLVGRRPDVAAARARVQAAASREDRARADFYPNINLAAVIGLQSLPINTLLTNDSQFGSFGPAISLPIFDSGARQATYRGSRGAYVEAAETYRQTVVQAYRDVADALAQRKALEDQLVQARAAVRASDEAHTIADQRYRAGLERYLTVLDAEDTLLAARRRATDLEAGAFNTDVALVRALGGGYRAPS